MSIIRWIPVKYCLRYLSCIGLVLLLNICLSTIYSTTRLISEDARRKPDIIDSFSKFHLNKQSIARYFEQKERAMKSSSSRIAQRHTSAKIPNKTSFLIYEHTRHRQFCQRQNTRSIYISTCPFQNCQFTCNSALIHRADAVLMLYGHLKYKPIFKLNESRQSNQRWILWHDEPYAPSPNYNNVLFNWTMSYRFDSEVSVAAYGITFKRNKPMNKIEFDKWINENYVKRRNNALWFVSNCAPKQRLKYYQQLKMHFPIIGFGRCIMSQSNNSQKCHHDSKCAHEKLSLSKFYLAFESTTSRIDYITEKFWRSFSYGLIPIVLGPKRRDYERVAPPGSFIYAIDFKTPQLLAKYLNDIATNQTNYEQYHNWRINYETRHLEKDVEPFRFCELCYRLNTITDRRWYTNINKYFLDDVS